VLSCKVLESIRHSSNFSFTNSNSRKTNHGNIYLKIAA